MKGQEKIAEGHTKKIYKTDQDDLLLMEFTDAVPLSGTKKTSLKGKGAINSEISAYLFDYLQTYNVPTHYIKKGDTNSLVVKHLKMIPLEMQIWNVSTSVLAKRIGISEGATLETPVIEFYLKDEKLKNPMINDYHAYALGLCDRNDMNAIIRIGTKVNAVLRSFFQRKNLALVHFTLEFGKGANQVMLGDEITPDNFNVWPTVEEGKHDKKVYSISAESAKTVYPALKNIILK